MSELFCEKKCCIARFCPLILAYATTVHKFQGFKAGFDEGDTINHIIADMGDLNWEKKNPGTAYVVTSCTKTIGTSTVNNPHPIRSNIFFDGQIGPRQFVDTLVKMNGEKTLNILQRDAWVEHLMKKEQQTTMQYTKDYISTLKSAVTSFNPSMNDRSQKGLRTKIMTMLREPNDQWKQRRSHYIVRSELDK